MFTDLDIVVNNLEAPALLFENRLCGGAGLEVDLRWPGSPNPRAIGGGVRLATAAATYLRTVQATCRPAAATCPAPPRASTSACPPPPPTPSLSPSPGPTAPSPAAPDSAPVPLVTIER